MKNRYDKTLREYNQQIITLNPAKETLYFIAAAAFKRVYKKGNKVLELGCGEGDSIKYFLELTNATFDLLDVSQEMIGLSKQNLKNYKSRVRYICNDALEYLQKADQYNIIYSSWVLHNFVRKEREELLAVLYKNMAPNGTFILFEKIYPSATINKKLLDVQLKRYGHLQSQRAQKEIIAHEQVDFSDEYRIDEKPFIALLKKIGFKYVEIIDRVERDVVLIARK